MLYMYWRICFEQVCYLLYKFCILKTRCILSIPFSFSNTSVRRRTPGRVREQGAASHENSRERGVARETRVHCQPTQLPRQRMYRQT